MRRERARIRLATSTWREALADEACVVARLAGTRTPESVDSTRLPSLMPAVRTGTGRSSPGRPGERDLARAGPPRTVADAGNWDHNRDHRGGRLANARPGSVGRSPPRRARTTELRSPMVPSSLWTRCSTLASFAICPRPSPEQDVDIGVREEAAGEHLGACTGRAVRNLRWGGCSASGWRYGRFAPATEQSAGCCVNRADLESSTRQLVTNEWRLPTQCNRDPKPAAHRTPES